MFRLACGSSALLIGFVMIGCNPFGNSSQKLEGEAKAPSTAGLDPKATGYYEVKGTKVTATSRSSVSKSGLRVGNDSPVEVEWPVGKADFEKLKEGMTLEEVRKVLALDTLKYNPPSEESKLQLVLKQGPASVTLIISGKPEVKLSSLSSQGLN